ncbi:type 4a pilus biogenesis protein PilO [Candidatus Parcubacteria bacterium]|nr:type 4a pilus biogenesis protein PilO [Candidatus Parcubacteria bacterium]
MKNSSAIVLLLISAGLFYTFIDPEYQKVKVLQAEKSQYDDVLGSVSALDEKRSNLQSKFKSISPNEITRLNTALPNNTDTVKLAVALDNIASRYGITIRSIRTAEGGDQSATIVQPSSNTYETTQVEFSIVATYDNFRRFLDDLEKSLRLVDVTIVNFSASDTGVNQYSLSVKTYWVK